MPSSNSRRARSTDPAPTTLRAQRRSRLGRRVLLMILAAFVLLGATSLLGPHTSTRQASGGGYDLKVVYPAVTRPGLAIRWIVFIHRTGGFSGPIQLATTATYFNLFDFADIDPDPSSQITSEELSIWEFDPPPGETLRVTLDARLEPARQHGSTATTSILEDDVPVVSIRYQTRVMP
ncbi:MAG: hypothetical protein ACRDHO_13895 [Actinomycetota bacterium]